MSEPPAKRRRTQFSVAEKKEIVSYKTDHRRATQDEIAAHFPKSWGKQVGRSTVSDILRDRSKWASAPKDSDNTLRHRTGKHENLENALGLWFNDVRSKNAYVNDQMLLEKALYFGNELKIEDFNYSKGWLQKFKKRHHISSHIVHGEASSADPAVVMQGRQQLQEELSGYNLDDIYNMDETGLFYRLPPNSTLATGPVSGKKKQKDRITVALCCNASGTDKLVPLVIGKAQRPRCFGKTFDPSVYVHYTYNTKAWMTSEIFNDWIVKFNRRMRLAGRHIILLLDNATSHSADLRLSHIVIKFLPPNTTSHIQPMDAGIIRNFKSHYKQLLVRYFQQCIEDNQNQTVSLKLAISYVKQSWSSVKQSTIVNCWNHVKILPQEIPDIDKDEDNMPLGELRRLLQRMPADDRMEATEYISCDNNLETGESLSDTTIMELVTESRSNDPSVEDDDDEEPDELLVSRGDARKGLTSAISYCEHNPDLAGHLDTLWKTLRAIESYSGAHIQKTIMDFVVKK